jgi:tripartite-type tricarboxylate transporter receptor subunit TctC
VGRRALLALAAAFCAAPAFANSYPAKPITLIVPFVAGGTTDIVGRILADGLGKELGQPVVVDNRGGAGGNIGASMVAQAAPDGYTLLLGYNGTNAINPSLYKKIPWDPVTSFAPISLVARVNNVVVVNPALPVKTLQELSSYAKAHSGQVSYGSAGAGSIFHLAGEMYAQLADLKITHVPYKGAAPALVDLMAGQTQFMISTIPAALPHIRSGKLRAIAVTGGQRSPLFPELPTALESGYPPMIVDSWFAVFAPGAVPEGLRTRLNQAIHKVLTNPEYAKRMEEQGAQPMPSSAAQLARLLNEDISSWRTIIRNAKVSLD